MASLRSCGSSTGVGCPGTSLQCHCTRPNRNSCLTRRPNQGHTTIIAKLVRPVPGDRPRVFCCRMIAQGCFNSSNLFQCIFLNLKRLEKWFDTSGKSRAKRHHRKNCKTRAEKSDAGFFISESDGGREQRRHVSPRPSHGRRSVSPSELL